MMLYRYSPLLLACCLAAPLQAQNAVPPSTIEIGHERSRLDNGTPHWRETDARIQHTLGKHSYVALGLLDSRRFGQKDSQIAVAYAAPLSSTLVGTVEASFSDTHRVLAKRSVGLSTQYAFAPAWLAHTGIRNTRYDAVSVNQGSLGLEHYIADFSWMATWYPVRAFATTANSFAVRGNYYYGERSFVGLIAATGEEATPIGASNVVVADIRSLALIGRHTLTPSWH